jgi:hypothetical protein
MPTPKTDSFTRSIWRALFGTAGEASDISDREAEPRTLEEERVRIRQENPHGLFEGRHYTEYVDEVRRLKKTDPAAAENLLLHLIDVVESEAKVRGWKPAPWYYEQLAILRRKGKDYTAEVAILERHECWYPGGGKFAERLEKARALAARQG